MSAPTFPRDRRQPSGFTLVELLIVVMVLGVMAGVAAPRYQAALAGVELEAATKQLVCDLRHVRQEAIRRGVTLGVAFDTATASYQSMTIAGETIGDPDHPGSPLSVTLGGATTIAMVVADFGGSPDVSFDFRGDPSASGSIELTNGSTTSGVQVNLAGNVERTP